MDKPANKGLRALGLLLFIAGVGAGGFLLYKSTTAVNDTVAKYARAPIGCTTTLQFDHGGSFAFFVETKGTMGKVDGDCSAAGTAFHHTGSTPKVSLSLTDGSGATVTINAATGWTYDTSDHTGAVVGQATIAKAGTYRLAVSSDATDIAVAVGGDPNKDTNTIRMAGIGALAAGIVLGGLLLILSRGRTGGAEVAPVYAPAAQYSPYAPAPAPQPMGWQPPPPPTPPAPPPPPPAPGGWQPPHQ